MKHKNDFFKSNPSSDPQKKYKLILHNDDIHSFEEVIEHLTRILNYDTFQSEQLALIAHLKGKSTLKIARFEQLLEYHKLLERAGLICSIE